jgi:hypothetical protein
MTSRQLITYVLLVCLVCFYAQLVEKGSSFEWMSALLEVYSSVQPGQQHADYMLHATVEADCVEGINWLAQTFYTGAAGARQLREAAEWCIKCHSSTAATLAALLSCGVDVLPAQGEHDSLSLLHLVASTSMPSQKRCACAELLIANAQKAQYELISKCDEKLQTAVHVAAQLGHVGLLCVLLSKADHVEKLLLQRDWQERTPLHIAANACCAVDHHSHCRGDYRTHCVRELIATAQNAGCLEVVLTAQDAAGVTAATWLLRVGYPLRLHIQVLPLACAKVSHSLVLFMYLVHPTSMLICK